MRRPITLFALCFALAPASVLACGMQYEYPEEIAVEAADETQLVALMDEIDATLETEATADSEADVTSVDASEEVEPVTASTEDTATNSAAEARKAKNQTIVVARSDKS